VSHLNYTNLTINNYWQADLVKNGSNNPVVDFYYGLSPPCTNINDKLSYRGISIDGVFEEGECSFINTSTIFNPLYFDTGFYESEYNVL
jgi:hypothetical protein